MLSWGYYKQAYNLKGSLAPVHQTGSPSVGFLGNQDESKNRGATHYAA